MTANPKEKIKFDCELLLKIVKRDEATIDKEKYKNMKINRDTKIKFKCKCGQCDEKSFRRCYENGGLFCSSCTKINTHEKVVKTNLERHGCENPMQNLNVQAKFKETSLQRHGVEHPWQNLGVRAKIKETNLKRYGYEIPIQNPDVQAKRD